MTGNSDNKRSAEERPVGELYSRLYLRSGAPEQDNSALRVRLGAFVEKMFWNDRNNLADHFSIMAGYKVPYSGGFRFDRFFEESAIEDILNAVTLIWRFLNDVYAVQGRQVSEPAETWRNFVADVFREENLAYSIDGRSGVHYLVDEEYERNRLSALSCLQAKKYGAVRDALEDANKHLDAQPPETKASVRSSFEALESLYRVMTGRPKETLTRARFNAVLAPLIAAAAADALEREAASKAIHGIGVFIEGVHPYRHGQTGKRAVQPSFAMAVYVLSSVSAAIRWVVDISGGE